MSHWFETNIMLAIKPQVPVFKVLAVFLVLCFTFDR
jgi:hypothetical protein